MNQIGKSAQITVPSANASPARTTRIIKKVDLGAAANYGKDQSNVSVKLFLYYSFSSFNFLCNVKLIMIIMFYLQNSTIIQQNNTLSSSSNQQKTKNDILNDIFESQNDNNRLDDDDFNPRANTQSYVQPQNTNVDFGDFTSAFTNPTAIKIKDNNDEFADFTSAFNNVVISNSASQPQSQINLMGVTIPTINPAANNTNSNNLIHANTIQTAGTTMFGGTIGAQKSNDLFDSLMYCEIF